MSRSRISLGVLVDWLESEYQARLLRGIAGAGQKHGVNVLCFAGGLLRSPHLYGAERNLVYELAGSANVDGMIVLSGALVNLVGQQKLTRYLERYQPLPMSSIGVSLQAVPSVFVENEGGMRQALVHLIERHQHRRIAFIRGPGVNEEAERRYRVYREVLAEHGVPLNLEFITMGDFAHATGIEAVRVLFDERKVKLDAIVAASDTIAVGATEALLARGIRVPEEVAVVGFDDLYVARYAPVPLTTVRQPLGELGRRAVDLVLRQIQGETVPMQTVLQAELVTRQSCGCPPATASGMPRLDVPEVTGSMAVGLSGIRAKIGREIADAVALPPGVDPALLARVLDAFLDDLRGDQRRFVAVFDEVLRAVAPQEDDLDGWQAALTTLRSYALTWAAADETGYRRAEDLLQQARALLGYARERVQAQKHLRLDRLAQVTRRLGEAVSAVTELPGLAKSLPPYLGELGIQSCFVALFEQSSTPPELRLVFGEHRKAQATVTSALNQVYPAERLLPDSVWPEHRHLLYVQPLCSENIRLGVMVTEPGPGEGFVYELVRDEVSSALKTIGLYQRLAEEALRREQSELAQIHKEEAIAAQVQTWVLPRDAEVQGLRIAAAMLPAPDPGGTYYDVLAGEIGSFIAFGDVTGYGLGTSVIAVMLQTLIAALVQSNPDALPSEIVRGVNRALSESLEHRLSRQEQVALALIRYEPSGRIIHAGAGQEVLICRATSGQFESLLPPGEGGPGVVGLDHVPDREIQLFDGDLLMMCSLGVTLARNAAGEEFGRGGILREIHDLHLEPVEVIREHLIEVVRAWEPEQRDDISVLIARYRSPA